MLATNASRFTQASEGFEAYSRSQYGRHGGHRSGDPRASDHLSELFGSISALCIEQFEIIDEVFTVEVGQRLVKKLLLRVFNDPAFGIQAHIEASLFPPAPRPALPLHEYLLKLAEIREKLDAFHLILADYCRKYGLTPGSSSSSGGAGVGGGGVDGDSSSNHGTSRQRGDSTTHDNNSSSSNNNNNGGETRKRANTRTGKAPSSSSLANGGANGSAHRTAYASTSDLDDNFLRSQVYYTTFLSYIHAIYRYFYYYYYILLSYLILTISPYSLPSDCIIYTIKYCIYIHAYIYSDRPCIRAVSSRLLPKRINPP